MRRRILLIAHSREDVRNLLPLADALGQIDESFERFFVSLEPFFAQGIDADLEAANAPYVVLRNDSSIDLRGERRPTVLLRAAREATPQIKRLVEDAAAVVCGQTGIVERAFAAFANEQDKPTAVFQPGFLASREPSARRRVRRFATGFGARALSAMGRREFANRGGGKPFVGFTSVFAMGEESRDELARMGASDDAIVVSGLPRLAPAFELGADSPTRASAPVVLYLTGAWRWHGDLAGEQVDRDHLRSLCSAAEAWSQLRVRVHPRDDSTAYEWCLGYENVELTDSGRELYREVGDAAIVVARSSTAVLEGVVGGRLGVLIDPPLGNEARARWGSVGLDRLVQRSAADAVAFINRAIEDPLWATSERREQLRRVSRVISPDTPRAAAIAATRFAGQLATGGAEERS